MVALTLSTCAIHLARPRAPVPRVHLPRSTIRPRIVKLMALANEDVEADRIVSGEWEASWSLASYDDVQEYFNSKALKEGHHPTTRLSSVMSTDLRMVYPDDPISEATAHFGVVSGLPVLRPGDDALIGVVTVKDVNTKTGHTVRDFMTHPPIALQKTNLVEHAAALMLKHKIHRIPVVDEKRRVVGMVTRTDLFGPLVGSDQHLED